MKNPLPIRLSGTCFCRIPTHRITIGQRIAEALHNRERRSNPASPERISAFGRTPPTGSRASH